MDPATIALLTSAGIKAMEVLGPILLSLFTALAARGAAATLNEQVSDASLGKTAGVVKAVAGVRKNANS